MVVTLLFQLLAQHSSSALPVSNLLASVDYKMLLLFNNIDSTRPISLSMNELTAEYWNSYAI